MKKVMIIALTLSLVLCVCVFPAAAAGSGALRMTDVEGELGETVTVFVNLNENPGLITMRFTVSYPSDLELVGVQDCGLLKGWSAPSPSIGSPYTLRWADSLATKNNTATGKIAALTFKIKDSATLGDKKIALTFVESRDVDGGKNIFGNAAATVTVKQKSHAVGDFSGDGKVNNDDVVCLLWHTLFPQEYPLAIDGDITNDGKVDNADVVALLWHTLFPEENPLK